MTRNAPLRVIGIGASAGGVDALCSVLSGFREDLPHAVLVVLHLPPTGRSMLAGILDRVCALRVSTAEHGERLEAGRVYVAPTDRHLVVRDGRSELNRGPKENAARPAVDPLLRSIAFEYGPAGVAVILSGALGDGGYGALTISQAGGAVVVQDPGDALVASMPQTTLGAVGEDAATVLPAGEIGRFLSGLRDAEDEMRDDRTMPSRDDPVEASRHRPEGPASGFTCPECSGALWELQNGDLVRYRCRVGHTYSEDAMLAEQGGAVEAALWAALEVLEERAEMLRRIADRRASTHPRTRERMEAAAADAVQRGELIRRALSGGARPDAFSAADEAEAEA